MDILSTLGTALAALIPLVIGALILLFVVRQAVKRYHIVPPSKALVISGRGKKDKDGLKTGARVITGGGAFVWPVIEEFDTVPMNVITITQRGDEVYDLNGLKFLMDWVISVQVEPTEDGIITHSRAFTGMDETKKLLAITETLSTNFRAICGTLPILTIHKDRDEFIRQVQKLAEDEMKAMGLRIVSMGVKDIKDDIDDNDVDDEGNRRRSYFEALGAPILAKIRQDAAIADAEADRDARIKAAEAGFLADQAEVKAKTSMVEQNEAFELREVSKELKVGLQKAQKDEQVAEKRALANQKAQEADVLVPARADATSKEIIAKGEQQKIEITAEANAKATTLQANATANATRQTQTANADGKKALLLAEADGTRAKGLAEAESALKLAEATASKGQINLVREFGLALIQSRVEQARAIATLMAGIGGNVRIVDMSGGNSSGKGSFASLLSSLPGVAAEIDAQVQALTGGMNLADVFEMALSIARTAGKATDSSVEEAPAPTEKVAPPAEETPAPTEEVAPPAEETPAPTEEVAPPAEETPAKPKRAPRKE